MGGIIRGIERGSNLSELIKKDEERKLSQPEVDRSLVDGGVWERATFTVPADVPDERVQEAAHKYRSKAADVLQAQGFTILEMVGPQVTVRPGDPPDRRRYDILSFVKRRPVEMTFDVPDQAVKALQKKGLKLKE